MTAGILTLAGFIVLFCVIVLFFVARNVSKITPFLYSNARLMARTPFLIKNWEDLIKATSLKEMASLLKETEYEEELDKIDVTDLKQLHTGFEKSYINSINELKTMSPKQIRPFFNSYLMLIEAKVLKTLYRAKFSGHSIDKNLLFPFGTINHIILERLIECETIKDMMVVMEKTVYEPVFTKAHDTLEAFEVALDGFVLHNLAKVTQSLKIYESNYLQGIIEKRIDILNILALLKFRIRNIPKEKQIELLIQHKSDVSARFKELIHADELTDFVQLFKGLDYYEALNRALKSYQEENSYSHFEKELLEWFKTYVVDADLNHTLGPYPLLSYVIKKEFELRNLFIISKGIQAGMNANQIREMLL